MNGYRVNVMQIVKIVTKEQGIFFVRVHDGFKIWECIEKAAFICDIKKINYTHIEIIEPSEYVLSGFAYDEVWNVMNDVVMIYKNKKVVSVERVSE